MADAIKKGKLTKLKMRAIFQLGRELDRSIADCGGSASLDIESIYADYKKSLDYFSDVLETVEKSIYTDEIQGFEDAMDNIIRSIIKINNASLNHYDAEVVAAAKKNKILFDDRGDITKLPNKDKIGAIVSIIKEFEGNYKASAEKVGIFGWIQELKKKNDEYEEKTDARYNERAKKLSEPAGEARDLFEIKYKALIERINALIVINGIEKYSAFINRFNAVLEKYGIKSGSKAANNSEPGDNQDKYPDAKEWEEDLPFMGVENGDIYYILVDGKKVFYKLVDKNSFFDSPDSAKGESGWEKLS